MVAGWNDLASQSPLAQKNPADDLKRQSPLARSDWSRYFQQQVPETGWWQNMPSPFSYDAGTKPVSQMDYHPGSAFGGTQYSPDSMYGMDMIFGEIDQWLAEEFPELFDFTANWQTGGVGAVGTIARDPNFGQFYKTPEVYDEIQAAANKYGVPVNFLQAIIAKESSGDWASNSTPAFHRGQRIHGYIGVYEDAARSWGFDFDRGIGNRAYQIEILAGGLRMWYDRLHAQNPQYGWLNVAAMHYSGDPTGNSTPADSVQHGTGAFYMQETQEWWQRLDAMAGNTWSNYTDQGQMTGVGNVNAQAWAPVNQWNAIIAAAAQKYGVPANFIKAIMRLESSGNANEVSPAGAIGLMQVMPFHVNGDASILYDPATNVDVGTRILMENYRQWGSWELAAKAYLAGNPYSTARDDYGTGVNDYWQVVNGYWQELNAAGGTTTGGQPLYGASPAPSAGPMLQINAIWGGGPMNTTQPYLNYGGPDLYWYGVNYGLDGRGHTGIDIGMSRGSTLYSATAGTVEYAGPEQSFKTYRGDSMDEADAIWAPQTGGLWIRLDNGHQIIYGHMDHISVVAGQRVTPGMVIGQSGAMNGAHLHLEYRVPDPSTPSGWRIVDPQGALSGQFNGTFGPGLHQSAPQGLGYTVPFTYGNLMKYAAMGKEIPAGAVYSMGGGASGWNAWLRQAMAGMIPYGASRRTSPSYQFTYSISPAQGSSRPGGIFQLPGSTPTTPVGASGTPGTGLTP